MLHYSPVDFTPYGDRYAALHYTAGHSHLSAAAACWSV
jgi:hypothetical protein